MTRKAGIVGWPVTHSLSPVLHGYWLKEYGIDGEMLRVPARPEEFADVIARLRAEGFQGVNITVPHKEAAYALADTLDKGAEVCGAVNLLVFGRERIEGRNTDHSGLHISIVKSFDGNPFRGKNALLLGAGGAARGAVLALDSFDVAKIYILNRDAPRATALAAELSPHINAKLVAGRLDDWKNTAPDSALVVNSTSAGMTGNGPLDLDLSALNESAAVCDIVYNPLQTQLLKDAGARGHKTVDGLGMLMYQAVPSFEAFFGRRPQVTPGLRTELERVLRERQA
jgi:shikimate dehydrogenase